MTVFIYGLLQKTLSKHNELVFNLDWLYKSLEIAPTDSRKKKRVKENLLQLQNDNYINFDCDIRKVNKNKLLFATWTKIEKSFTPILISEFDAIHGYSGIDNDKLFCLFASIKSRVDSKKYCYPGYKLIRMNTHINSDTAIAKYLKILKEELHLIDYESPGEIVITNNGKKETSTGNNIYVFTCEEGYKEILKKVIEKKKLHLKEFYELNNIKIKSHDEANKKRSETMKKNWAKKKGIELDNDDSDDWGTTHNIDPFAGVDSSQLVDVDKKDKVISVVKGNSELPEYFIWNGENYPVDNIIEILDYNLRKNNDFDLMDYVFVKENEKFIKDLYNRFMDKFITLKVEKQEQFIEGYDKWLEEKEKDNKKTA